jgi:hypothetical protein
MQHFNVCVIGKSFPLNNTLMKNKIKIYDTFKSESKGMKHNSHQTNKQTSNNLRSYMTTSPIRHINLQGNIHPSSVELLQTTLNYIAWGFPFLQDGR